MKPQVGTSWEQKMQQKASRQQFLDFKREAVNSAKEKRKVRVRGCVVVLYGGCGAFLPEIERLPEARHTHGQATNLNLQYPAFAWFQG